CPVLKPSYVGAGVFEPDAREIDVHALHQGFVRGARRLGTSIQPSSQVVALEQTRNGWTLTTSSGRWDTGVVVNAAGAWCDEVARLAGARPVGLQPMRRTAFTFPAPEGVDVRGLPFINDVDEQWYFKPEGVGFLGSLSEETPMEPHDVSHTERDVALAIKRISAAVTFPIRHVHSAWAGLRSFVADRIPVIGADDELPGFFWLAGQGGFGIMTSPASARALAGLVTEGGLPPDVKEGGLEAEDLAPARLR
ncbi:MAG: NAD(P)/FAD-dependent oxidoreductase, partial [Acidimicrobiia bacterium]